MYLNFKQAILAFTVTISITATTFAHGQIPQSLPLHNPFQPTYITSNTNGKQPNMPLVMSPAITNVTRHFKLNYISATEIKEVLQSLCTNSKISAEPISNIIVFTGSQDESQHIQQTIKSIDNPSYQITLEAKIISLSNEESKNLGISWNWDKLPQTTNDTANRNTSDNNGNHGNFKFWHDYSFKFGAMLNALQSKGKAKLLAAPHIITLPGKKASIFIGDHIPVQTEQHSSSGNYTSTEYLDAGIKLEYTPIVNADGTMVTATVHTEVSTPSLIAEIKNYKITSRTVDTNIRMKNGETLVIGGLISDEEQKTIQQIPLLSKLPILGHLFKNRSHAKAKTEVILILTPYITPAGQSPAIYENSLNTLTNNYTR